MSDVTDFDKIVPEAKAGQVWRKKSGKAHSLSVEDTTYEVTSITTLAKTGGDWRPGVTYSRVDLEGPQSFWRENSDFYSHFDFVRQAK